MAQIGLAESSVYGIAKAVSWLRAIFSQAITIEDLATLAHMGASSFHQHFKAVTSMSPVQFQKALRLQEARRLIGLAAAVGKPECPVWSAGLGANTSPVNRRWDSLILPGPMRGTTVRGSLRFKLERLVSRRNGGAG